MKKFLFTPSLRSIAIVLVAYFAFGLSARARTISLEEAMVKAQRFLYPNSTDSISQARGFSAAPAFTLAYEARTTDKRASCFYVLNQTFSQGYIIVSADDRLPEVLGYSDNGEFDINKIPDNMKWWLSEYERQIEQVLASSNNSIMPITETNYRDGWTEIEPLVKTKWHQYEPYDNQCPTINGEKAPTGCVATAMAQIMKYHQWPARGKGSHSYEWSGGHTLSMNFSEVIFDWANIKEDYQFIWDYGTNSYIPDWNLEEENAVATLMQTCGISVDMNYGLDGSSASSYSAAQALIQYFDYDANFLWRGYVELPDWESLIYDELLNQRPVYYSGTSTSYSGHAFVCDGYSSEGLFHINWGWGGQWDGYFLLSVLNPYGTEYGYKYDQAIVYGICPIEKVKIDGVYYRLIKGENEAFVSTPNEGYYTGELTIPATVSYENKTYTVMEVNNDIWDYCQDLTSLIVYAPINEIRFGAWDNPKVEKLETVKLFNVNHIGMYAFKGCTNLKTLEFGDNLESIGAAAFQGCSALTELIIPDNVTFIDEYAFTGGSRLEKIVIPNSVVTIGDYAFDGGGSSTTTTIISQIEEPFDLPANTFSSSAFTRDVLYVPYGTTEKYQAKEVWKNFENTVEYLTVSVGADGLATYCPTVVGVDFSKATDIAAYKASVNGSTVNLTKVTTVAAGEGVLLRSFNGGAATEYLPVATSAIENTDNAFVGTLVDIEALTETEGNITNFVLSKKDGVVGFYKANNTHVAAGKAYLPVENYNPAARGLSVTFDDGTTTGVSEVMSEPSTTDDIIYTLSGARVKSPAKGLYIKNGKKVVVK